MLKNTNKYQTLLAVCLLTLSACSTNETLTDSPIDQNKTPIELTVGILGENPTGDRAQTRTVVTTDNPYGQSAEAFGANTSLYMVIKGDKEGSTSKYTRSIGTVTSGSEVVSFADGYQRYWEDSYSRDSKLSVYSACVPGSSTDLTVGGSATYNPSIYNWSTDAISPTITWPLTGVTGTGTFASQNATFLTNQDLCFSNNVSNISSDNRMVFDTDTKKFVARQMIFHHALTKVTFQIKRGDGFGTGTGVFNFTNAATENIVLKGFNTSGTLDMSTGEFSPINTDAINALSLTDHRSETSPAFDYELTGLMLPGSALTSTATDEVYFTIDDNKYHIKKSDLASALSSKTLTNTSLPALNTDSKMRPGVKYIFTMTVSKKGIDKLSASVVPWASVEANGMTPSNARISVSVMTNGQKQTGNASFDLYRSPYVNSDISDEVDDYTWGTGYTGNKAHLTENTTVGEYTAYVSGSNPLTPWYWPDNKTFYHFRTVMPNNHPVTQATNDYLTLTGAASYTDVCWGAPFYNPETSFSYDLTNGFDGPSPTHQISRAIGPTTDPINMMMFHMMSNVTINLTTTTGIDAVNLNGATISLSNIHPTGTVLMGNGLVTATGDPGNVSPSLTYNSTYKTSKVENYGFVPQSLEDVVLTITTADNNRYIVDMKDVEFTASSISNTLIANPYSETSPGSGNYKINRWYPNFKYTYTFQLKKTGIESISATINDWENISADPQTVQIK